MKYLITMTLVIALILTSCTTNNSNKENNPDTSTPSSNEDSNMNNSEGTDSDEALEVTYENIAFEALSDPMKNKVEYLKENPGYEVFTAENGDVYLFIGVGMQPTGGYALKITDLTSKDDRLTVEVDFKKPDPDDIVTQALTYPHVIVKLDKMYDEINIEGNINFSPYVYDIEEGTGTYVGQIDPSSIEVETSDGFIVLRSYYMENLLEGLSENDPVSFEYVMLETNQNGLIDLTKTE
jgi:hypothetical protein